jgi:hypothetical protein
MSIHYSKSNKDNMLKLKKDKNLANIKQKEEIILMTNLIYINIVRAPVHIKHKWTGHKNKK